MTNHGKRFGFTMAEVLTALGIIGVLCVTTLAMTNIGESKYNLAATKIAQTESAIKSWGIAQSGGNETGLGAFAVIESQAELEAAVIKALDNPTAKVVVEDGKRIIPVGNGVVLEPTFKTADCGTSGIPCATIAVSSTVNGSTSISEQYAVYSDGVKSAAEMYEGYEQYFIGSSRTYQTFDANGNSTGSFTVTCPNGAVNCAFPPECTDKLSCETTTVPDGCKDVPNGGSCFTKKLPSRSCDNPNATGEVLIKIVDPFPNGDPVTTEINQCCVLPKTFNEKFTSEKNRCICPAATAMQISDGFQYDATAEACQKPCPKGTYGKDGVCNTCTKGSYCPDDGMTAAITCPNGSYCPDDGMTAPTACPAGYYCNEVGLTEGKPCPAGYYCAGGNADKEACPAGTASKIEKATSDAVCVACTGNTYAATAGSTECKACPNGSKAKNNNSTCESCPLGQQYNENGVCETCTSGTEAKLVDGIATCVPCAAGTISKTVGGIAKCEPCPAGYSCANGVATKCPAGTYSAAGASGCTPCSAGTYSNKSGATSCTQCAAGSYSPELKAGAKVGATSCTLCAVGYVTDKIGQTSCTACPAGKYSNIEGGTTCSACPAGKYQDKIGQAGCTPCAKGTASDKTGLTTACSACSCGTYQDETGKTSCKRVAAGYYAVNANNTYVSSNAVNQKACDKGYACPGKCNNKEICPAGAYASDANGEALTLAATTCTACPAGKYSPKAGSTSCTACEVGKYQDQRAQASCKLCDVGTASNKTGLTTACPACEIGTYQDETGKTSCKPVAAGYYAVNKDGNYTTKRAVKMEPCGKGYACAGGSADRKLCAAGTYASDSKGNILSTKATRCTNCQAGYKCAVIPGQIITEKVACACDTYQNATKQTTCKPVSAGYYATSFADTKNSIAAKSQTICPAGSMCLGYIAGSTSCNARTLCQPGTYQNEKGKTSCKSCDCGTYTSEAGKTACSKMNAGTYFGDTGSAQANGIACTSDKYATAEQYCPAGSCAPKNSCPVYASIYIITDGHTHNWNNYTLDSLLNTFTCIDKGKIENYSNIKQTSANGNLIFMFAKVTTGNTHKFVLLDTFKWKHNTYDFASISDYIDSKNKYYFNSKGIKYNAGCGGHSSSIAGGILTIKNSSGVECKYNVGLYGKVYSPLVLDMDGDGKQFTNIDEGVMFDLDANGKIEKTSWTGVQYTFDDAFLCSDRNGDGVINDGGELFGDQHGAETGFDELAKFDDSGDGFLSSKDNNFSNLKLWVDHNKNGVVDYFEADDYELIVSQITDENGIIDLSKNNNLQCSEDGCHYFVKKCVRTVVDTEVKESCLNKAVENLKRPNYCKVDGTYDAFNDKSIIQYMFGWWNTAEEHAKKCKEYSDELAKKEADCIDLATVCDEWAMQQVEDASPKSGATIELRGLDELRIKAISTSYSKELDADGNIKKDEHGNVIGMVGEFFQEVWNAAKQVWEIVKKSMIDVWFQTDTNV